MTTSFALSSANFLAESLPASYGFFSVYFSTVLVSVFCAVLAFLSSFFSDRAILVYFGSALTSTFFSF